MKFPETKTRSPFYKMLSPLVEKAPMVPFISSFLRRRPGPGLFVQMGCRERAQGRRGRGRGAARGGGAGWEGAWERVRCPAADEWTRIVPREAPAAGRQVFGKDGFPSSGSAPRPRQVCRRSRPYLSGGCSPPSAQAAALGPRRPSGLTQQQARQRHWTASRAPARSNPHASPSTAATHPPSPHWGGGRGDQAPSGHCGPGHPHLKASVPPSPTAWDRTAGFCLSARPWHKRPPGRCPRSPCPSVFILRMRGAWAHLGVRASPVSAGMEAS